MPFLVEGLLKSVWHDFSLLSYFAYVIVDVYIVVRLRTLIVDI